jgi:hypothetical protein
MGSHAPVPPAIKAEGFPDLPAPSDAALIQDTTRLVFRQTSAALMPHTPCWVAGRRSLP